MDKETLSNYGWIVIAVLVLAVMIALATPFGQFIEAGVKSTAQGLFDVNKSAGAIVGLDIPDQTIAEPSEGGNSGSGGSGTTCTHIDIKTYADDKKCDCGYVEYGADVQNGLVPEGATYTKADGTVLNAGDSFPETVADNDRYTYGDYKYIYLTSSNGWRVTINYAVTDKNQTSYGAILESINGQSVTNMEYTFQGCTALTTAPVLPNSVTDMTSTFRDCTSLTDVSNLVIPSSVTDMTSTFEGCTALITAPEIPNSVTDMTTTFQGCTALTTAPEIPSSVTDMEYTFCGCTSLTGTITINATPKHYNNCLKHTEITNIYGSCTIKNRILATK